MAIEVIPAPCLPWRCEHCEALNEWRDGQSLNCVTCERTFEAVQFVGVISLEVVAPGYIPHD